MSLPRSGTARVALSGDWLLGGRHPSAELLVEILRDTTGLRRLEYEAAGLRAWDTGLVHFVVRLEAAVRCAGIEVARGGLPAGARRLLELAEAVPEADGRPREPRSAAVPARPGRALGRLRDDTVAGVDFLGRLVLSLGRLLRGRADFRPRDLAIAIQESGAEALGLVGVLSVLAGVILGVIASLLLSRPGGGALAAELVGPTTLRVLAPIVAAVAIAGRSGAGYAARLGTMRAGEEIDALRAVGVDPFDFLVLPRALALTLVTPLLSLYSAALGLAAAAVVGIASPQMTAGRYLADTWAALGPADLAAGLLIALVCGPLVAVAGCRRALDRRGDGARPGEAVASAVSTGIAWTLIACAALNLLFARLGI